MKSSIQYYKMLLRVVFDKTPAIPQTYKSSDGLVNTSLTPNYLCLQCSTIVPEEDREKHGQKKSHRFCESTTHSLTHPSLPLPLLTGNVID